MERIKRFQIRGASQPVERFNFDGRTVDFWNPGVPTEHLLIAHDGQNIFKRCSATGRRSWQMVQSAIKVSRELGIMPPAIIAVFHSRSPENPWGRIHDLAPEDPYQNGVSAAREANAEISLSDLRGNKYLEQITDQITPAICKELGLNLAAIDKAVIGSSMGGLASLYAMSKRPDFFSTALALSPHWLAGEEPLVDAIISALPTPGAHKIWMSHGTGGYDAKYGPFQRYADQKMRTAGWIDGEDFITRIYNRSGHNERSWAKYLTDPLRFWLSPSK
ncbi:MAG TPA: alpha/beta hydrolase-fold protein [Candidatus Paceibacterota bacterium]|nr:alpha/beta hydrolase-fold protein [Candidatus Paceibacterota bacterium]